MLLSSKSSKFASEGIVLLRAKECRAAWCVTFDTGLLYMEIFRDTADCCDEDEGELNDMGFT